MGTAEKLAVAIVGLGYVGVTAAACLSAQGHSVVGVDISEGKIDRLNRGESPVIEPGLDELISEAVTAGNLRAQAGLPSLKDTDIVIVCVGTPSAPDGSHNMSFIAESARQIAAALADLRNHRVTLAFRSTFKPGTMEELIIPIFRKELGDGFREKVELVYNPEFLRESTAVEDYFNPPKIVIGTENGKHSTKMAVLHSGLSGPIFETGFKEAEYTKFVDNTWHAVKVAFANEMGRIASAHGVLASAVHEMFVADTKLNVSPYYLRPGGAFGGSCLPKDVRAMQYLAKIGGVKADLIGSLIDSNQSHKQFQLQRVVTAAPQAANILVAGLAFKTGTDDLRESPNVTLVAELIRHGYNVRVVDSSVFASTLVGQNLGQVLADLPSLYEVLISADEAVPSDYDLLVINNASVDLISGWESLPVVDLRNTDPVHG